MILRNLKTKFKNTLMQCFKEMLSDQEIENFEEELNRMRFREYENPFLDNLSSWMDEDQSTGLLGGTVGDGDNGREKLTGNAGSGRGDGVVPEAEKGFQDGMGAFQGSVSKSPSLAATMGRVGDAGAAARERNALSSDAGSAAGATGDPGSNPSGRHGSLQVQVGIGQATYPEQPEHGRQLGQPLQSPSVDSTGQQSTGPSFGATAASGSSKGWGMRLRVEFRTPNAAVPIQRATAVLKKSLCSWVKKQRLGCTLEAREQPGEMECFIDCVHNEVVSDRPEILKSLRNRVKSAVQYAKRSSRSWAQNSSCKFKILFSELRAQPEEAVLARMAASSRRQGFQRWYTARPTAKLQHTAGTPALSATRPAALSAAKTLAPETPALSATKIPALSAVVKSLGEEVLDLERRCQHSASPDDVAKCFEIALHALRVVHGYLDRFQGEVTAELGNGGTSDRCTPPTGQCFCICGHMLYVCVPEFFLAVNLLSHSCLTVLRVCMSVCFGSNFQDAPEVGTGGDSVGEAAPPGPVANRIRGTDAIEKSDPPEATGTWIFFSVLLASTFSFLMLGSRVVGLDRLRSSGSAGFLAQA